MDNKITCEQVQELLDDYGLADLDDVRFVLDQYQKVICNCTKHLSKLTYDASVIIAEICDRQTELDRESLLLDEIIPHTVIKLKEKVTSKNTVIVLEIPIKNYSRDELMLIYNHINKEFPNNHIIALPDDITLEMCSEKSVIPKLQKLINKLENKNK